jgi:hypothetical protein
MPRLSTEYEIENSVDLGGDSSAQDMLNVQDALGIADGPVDVFAGYSLCILWR